MTVLELTVNMKFSFLIEIVQEFIVVLVFGLPLLDGLGIHNGLLPFQELRVSLPAFLAKALPQVGCVVSTAQVPVVAFWLLVNNRQSVQQALRQSKEAISFCLILFTTDVGIFSFARFTDSFVSEGGVPAIVHPVDEFFEGVYRGVLRSKILHYNVLFVDGRIGSSNVLALGSVVKEKVKQIPEAGLLVGLGVCAFDMNLLFGFFSLGTELPCHAQELLDLRFAARYKQGRLASCGLCRLW